MNYKQIGFKCGIEIHNRLATKHKLFCKCPARFSTQKPYKTIMRKLRPVAGELGERDVAAIHEFLKNKTYYYQVFKDTTCLIELDEEPPQPLNKEALEIGLQVCKLLKAEIPEEIHVMRKTVIDGSNTTGFQRTALIGTNGILETSLGQVRISNISIEEESAGIIEKKENQTIFRLDRLGIPLIEIGTEPDIQSPEHAKEVAEKLGMIIRSTGKSQRGIGVTRQDINVSIKGGARVEIKGFQDLDMMPEIIKNEIKRQQELISRGEKPEEQTRVAKLDRTTEYMRPLPGGARMYPETDIPPIIITKQFLSKIKIPETWESKLSKFKKILPGDMAEQIIKSEYLDLFERFKKIDPVLVANIFTSIIKDLKRKGFNINNLTAKHFEEIFKQYKKGKLPKGKIPEILETLCRDPNTKIKVEVISEEQLRKIIKDIIEKNPDLVENKKIGALMGDIMKITKGKADGKLAMEILKELLK